MPSAEENIVSFAAKQAVNAMNDYAAGIADATHGLRKAIRAVIAYGEALLEGRKGRSNIAFSTWVSDNKLDVGEPWNDRKERHAAMQIAEIVVGSMPTTAFDACPNTRPTHIMQWYRKQNPQWQPAKAKPTTLALETIKATEARGEALAAEAVAREAGVSKTTALKALAIHRERMTTPQATPEPSTASPDNLARATAHFSEKSKLTVDKAIALHKSRLDKLFQTKVGEEVRRHLAIADKAMREQNAQLRQENIRLTWLLQQGALFSPLEFKSILMCLHPDNAASSEVRARAFDLVKQKERRLIGQ